MTPLRAKSASQPPRRMICINTSLGLHTPNLFPSEAGQDYKLTPYLEPLEQFRSDFTVFSGLSHPDVDGGHPPRCAISPPPHAAQITSRTPFRSINWPSSGWCPTRIGSLVLSSSSSRGLSFTRSGVAIPAEERPSRVFRSMFVDGTAAEIDAQVQRLKQGQSIMDTVLDEATDFQRGLGKQDREKLDEYFASVRKRSNSGWSRPRIGHTARSPKSMLARQWISPARSKCRLACG